MKQKYRGKAIFESEDVIEPPQLKDLKDVYYLEKDGRRYLSKAGTKSITASFSAIPFNGFNVGLQFMKNYVFVNFDRGADLVLAR